MNYLENSVRYIKGVGPKKSGALSNMFIKNIRDVLFYFPREYQDRTELRKIGSLKNGERAVVSGQIKLVQETRLSKNLFLFKAAIDDKTGILYSMFFRKINPYYGNSMILNLKNEFVAGKYAVIYGDIEIEHGIKQMNVLDYQVNDDLKNTNSFLRILPVYSLTESINQKWYRKIVNNCIDGYMDNVHDILSDDARSKHSLLKLKDALRNYHFPKSIKSIEESRKVIAFSELALFESALEISKRIYKAKRKKQRYNVVKTLLSPFKSKLGFEFTNAQKKAIREIFSDMQKTCPMNRVLMGDVGCGKTAVALSAVVLAIENGYQASILAPTEILAVQHYESAKHYLDEIGVKTAMVSGSSIKKSRDKKDMFDKIAKGDYNLVIGTHSLLNEGIKFKNLALVVIDEQHRFGVIQRSAFRKKASNPDVLLMSATPIPRTLALTAYGDLEISSITQLPPGRKNVKTLFMKDYQAYKFVVDEIKKGNQAFIVYPLIEGSDSSEIKAAAKEAARLKETVFRGYNVGLIHGRQDGKTNRFLMEQFKTGIINILISTTVIEVGINIPNATVMVVEHAEKFGLATLHQLRGRVGRGKGQSYCILIANAATENSKARIKAMISSNDGFKIAEEDLKLRGPGEFFGTAQHGALNFKAANLKTDLIIVTQAKETVKEILKSDPSLKMPKNRMFKTELIRLYSGKFDLPGIG